MKRRNHDIHPEDPSPIRTSFPEPLHRGRSTVTRPDSQSNRADCPKTSEFAFFKKLKKDAGQRFDSHSMEREKNQPNKLNSSECCRVIEGTKIVRNISKSSEGTNSTRNSSKDFRSPLSVVNISSKEFGSLFSIENLSSKDPRSMLPRNNVTHINFDSFLLPVDREANNSEVNLKNAFSSFESIFSIEDWSQHDSMNKRPGGSQSDQEELFSRKRQKLLQWAHNSFPEMVELCSKGYDLISMLLNRLLPWSNEKTDCRSADSAPVKSSTKTEIIACPKSDIPSKKLYVLPTRDIMQVEYTPSYLENGTSSYGSDRSRETMLSNIYSPIYNNHSTLQKTLELPGYELREKNPISCIDLDSILGFPFVRHGSFPPFSSLKEPDDLNDLNGSLPGREPHLSLLEWDSVNGTSSYWSERLRETVLSNIYSPTYNNENTLEKNLELPSCELREKNLISCFEGDSTFGFPFVKHGSFLPFSSFEEPNDDLKGSLPGREPHLPLLEWDSANMNERSLSATRQNTNWTIIPAVRSSWDHQRSLNNWCGSFGTLGLCSSPVVGNYPQEFYTVLVPPNSTSYHRHELGRAILEKVEETIADLHHLPLTSSHSSKCLNLIADCNHFGIACEGSETSGILPSPGNHLCFMSKAFGEENSTDFGTHLSFALDVDWKCLQSSGLRRRQYSSTYNDLQFSEKGIIYSNFLSEDEFESSLVGSSSRSRMSSEDMLDIHDWQSFYFQISRDKDKAYPLLLDKSSCEDFTEETYNSDSQVKCL
ncbi:hypothetical protein REPUB_Repub12eG0092100 [Reevesia pubescens]